MNTDTFIHDEYVLSPKNKVVRNNTKIKHYHIHNSLTHGDKLNGYTRILFENGNGLAPWKVHNDKIILARKCIQQMNSNAYTRTASRV